MEHLNEKNYQKGKKGLIIVGMIIIVVAICFGVFLIITGISKMKTSPVETDNHIEVIEQKIEELKKQKIALQTQVSNEFNKNGLSEQYYYLQQELSDIQNDIVEAETEIWRQESGYNQTKNSIEKSKGLFYIFPGIMVILFGIIIGSFILVTAFRRNILAWKVQEIMPIAQEGIEKISPTIAKVSKEQIETIAPAIGEIAKEIKDGLKDS